MSLPVRDRRRRGRAWRAAAALLGLTAAAWARERGDFEVAPPPSLPEPNPLQVEVRQGETAQIVLSAFSLTSPIVRYRIREKPRLGTLSPSPYVDGKTGLVRYRPRTGGGAGEDEFTYSVQSEAGVSAPAEVRVKILDSDPMLAVPLELDFGDVVLETSARREITLENVGGGTAEGTVEVPEGYRVEGSAEYRLLGGVRQTFSILFAPPKESAYDGVIQYTGNPDRATDLKGAGVRPVQVGASEVQLDLLGRERMGSVWLRNRTARPQTVRIDAGPRLSATDIMQVPANGVANVELHTLPDDYGVVQESVSFDGAAHGTVSVTAPAVPPKLTAQVAGDPGPDGAVRVTIGNAGGPGQVEVSATGAFTVAEGDRFFHLGPDEKRTLLARPDPAATATQEALAGEITAASGESRARVAISGSAAATPSVDGPGAPLDAAGEPPRPEGAEVGAAAEPGAGEPSTYLRALEIGEISSREAVLKWIPGVEATRFRLEAATLAVSGSGTVRREWQPLGQVEFRREGPAVIARASGLAPATYYFLRMRALDAAEQTLAVSGPADFRTPEPPRKSRAWLWAAVLAAAGYGYWRWSRRGAGRR